MPGRLEPGAQTENITQTVDPTISKLSDADFDPVAFLNDVLPSTTFASQPIQSRSSRNTQIQSVSTEVLSLLSTLNTHNIRASSDLTALTDEIIRSGNRLAYEVEILRGDVNNLHEVLTEALREDIQKFVVDEITKVQNPGAGLRGDEDSALDIEGTAEGNEADPDFLTRLRSLGQIKARLEAVVTVFGEALKWPLPPSELSMASSLISVSSPELGLQTTVEDDKAREIAREIRAEITDLLDSDGGGYKGLDAALKKVEEFRQLATVWKGTGEERARIKFIDSLAKIAEDRKKLLDVRSASQGGSRPDNSQRHSSRIARHPKSDSDGGGAAGLFRNLQRLKDDLYLE